MSLLGGGERKSAWASRINWVQAAGLAFTVAALFGLDVPEDVRKQVVTIGAAVVAVATWWLRTYHTSRPIKAK